MHQKRTGTHAASIFVVVAEYGEWSIGKISDVYFNFAMGGEQYLESLLELLTQIKKNHRLITTLEESIL